MKQIDISFKRKLHRERFLGPSTSSINYHDVHNLCGWCKTDSKLILKNVEILQ